MIIDLIVITLGRTSSVKEGETGGRTRQQLTISSEFLLVPQDVENLITAFRMQKGKQNHMNRKHAAKRHYINSYGSCKVLTYQQSEKRESGRKQVKSKRQETQ